MKKLFLYICLIIIFIFTALDAQVKVKIKNLVTIEGLSENSLIGYGIITGLNGTGDTKKFELSKKILTTMLNNLGIDIENEKLDSKNNALVLITAKLPAITKAGETIDANVASIGDAKSITAGLLLQAPLKGMDGRVYGIAEGIVTVVDSSEKNQASGIIPSGVILQQEFTSDFINNNKFIMTLNDPDFNTIIKIRDAIKADIPGLSVEVLNNKIIEISILKGIDKDLPKVISEIQNIEVEPETKARIVINKRSGVIVFSGDIKLLESAVSYKNIDISINNKATDRTTQNKNIVYLDSSSDIQSLIDGLNKLGAKTGDIISILYTLKKAGSLFAEIIVE